MFGYISLIKEVKAKFAQGGFFRIRFKEIRCCHYETVLKRTILCLYSFIRFPTDFYVSMCVLTIYWTLILYHLSVFE